MADFGANVLSSSVALLGLLAIMGLIYTIWSQINMKKKQKYFKELHTELKPGQEVLHFHLPQSLLYHHLPVQS